MMVDLHDIGKKRVVYTLPGMEAVTTRKDVTYKAIDGVDLKMDIYYPFSLCSSGFWGLNGFAFTSSDMSLCCIHACSGWNWLRICCLSQ